MIKDKDWLSEQVGELDSTDAVFNESGLPYIDTAVSIERVFDLIDQLDEPEVLSQELPVIPKYVADWIEGNKQSEEKWSDYDKEDAMNDTIHFTIYGLFADYPATNSHVELRKPVLKWLSVDRGNYFKLVNAVRYGYEVEKEPKFYVLDNEDRPLLIKFFQGVMRTPSDIDPIGEIEKKHIENIQFTEQEIKDYDERYLVFKEPVEELE